MDLSRKMRGLDLFSGIGGISKALEPWVTTVAYCERDKYAQAVLLSRMAEGKLDIAPIWDDIRTLDGTQFKGSVDIIFGGFPCQNISSAGRGEGLEGDRSSLFGEIVRLAQEIRPTFIFLENVPAIRTRGLPQVVRELAAIRYSLRWGALSAFDVGAPHKRERWFCLACNTNRNSKSRLSSDAEMAKLRGPLADTEGISTRRLPKRKKEKNTRSGVFDSYVAHAENNRPGRGERFEKSGKRERDVANSMCRRLPNSWTEPAHGDTGAGDPKSGGFWEIEPGVGRVVDGFPWRVDCLRALGNSCVPAQAREAFKRISGLRETDGESEGQKECAAEYWGRI